VLGQPYTPLAGDPPLVERGAVRAVRGTVKSAVWAVWAVGAIGAVRACAARPARRRPPGAGRRGGR
jgi:hypothetical protein